MGGYFNSLEQIGTQRSNNFFFLVDTFTIEEKANHHSHKSIYHMLKSLAGSLAFHLFDPMLKSQTFSWVKFASSYHLIPSS